MIRRDTVIFYYIDVFHLIKKNVTSVLIVSDYF